MPVPLPTRLSLISSFKDNEGRQIEARSWFIENLIKPLDGFKTWPRGERLCDEHRRRVGEIRPKRSLCRVLPHDECDGLRGEKILFVVLDVARQEGKTTSGAAYELTDLLEGRNCHCLFLAASESQSDRVFDQKFVTLLKSRPDLASRIEIGMDSLRNPLQNNTFLYVPTSAKSIAAGTYRLIFVDEVRDVDPEVITKLIMSMASVTGVECPSGHMTAGRPRCPTCRNEVDGFECDIHGEIPVPTCPACGIELDEFFGRTLLMSSAGEESAFFTQIVDRLHEVPAPNWHLFSSADRLNQAKSRATVSAFVEVLGDLDASRGLVHREAYNIPGSAGDKFLHIKEIEAVIRDDLANYNATTMRCVGFLDCSRTTDLTSLVMVGDPSSENGPSPNLFHQLRTIRIDVWDPKDSRQSPSGRVEYRAVREFLAELLSTNRFPGLLELAIDTRLLTDADELFDWVHRQPWGGRVTSFKGDHHDDEAMFDQLSTRIRELRIELPMHKRLRDELRGLHVIVSPSGRSRVVDSAKGNRRGGRKQLHRDVSMSLAGCCLLAAKYQARALDRSTIVATKLNQSKKHRDTFRPITGGMHENKF